MKLYALIVTDISDGVDKPYLEAISYQSHNSQLMIASDTKPDGYQEVNDPILWHNQREYLKRDYKWIRDKIESYGNVDDQIWDTYSNEMKDVVCSYKATNELRIKAFYGDDAEFKMSDFNESSVDCRKHRWSIMKSFVLTNVIESDRFVILGTLDAIKLSGKDITVNYIEHGVHGIGFGDDSISGLMNFIVGDEGFGENDPIPGLAHMSITMINGLTQQDMINKIIDIGHNGNYDYSW